MPKKIERLHVAHASMEFSDSNDKTRSDFQFLLNVVEPDIISFTEMGSKENLNLLRAVAQANNYRVYPGEAGRGLKSDDCCAAVKIQRGRISFKDAGTQRVHPGQYNRPEHLGGRYGPKNVGWVHAKFFGVDVYHHFAHWVHNQNEDALNRKRADMVSRMIANKVVQHGRKGAISFFAGDMNTDPDSKNFPHDIFRENKLITIWRDAGKQQSTVHGRGASIDVLGRYGADKRVEFVRYQVHQNRHSNHRPISAWYDIEVDGKKPKPQDPTPPDEDPSDPDGPVFSGGNIDWSDYTDKDIYALPQATDHSDTENG